MQWNFSWTEDMLLIFSMCKLNILIPTDVHPPSLAIYAMLLCRKFSCTHC